MGTTNTKVKTHTPASALIDKRGGSGTDLAQEKQFALAVDSIAKRFGVKVAATATPKDNPYAMSPKQAAQVAVEAGILTPAGKLKRAFK